VTHISRSKLWKLGGPLSTDTEEIPGITAEVGKWP